MKTPPRPMIQALKKYVRTHIFPVKILEKGVEEAYDIWSESYDNQPGNLMLYLDETLFSNLLADVSLTGKKVADIGCGTGRHWEKILQKKPDSLTGFDVSAGMLGRLKEKFPEAETELITDDLFTNIPSATYDLIVSTLTVAHIENLESALTAWSRIIKTEGDIILTDFHPVTLANGGKRTFRYSGTYISVQNFVHPTQRVRQVLEENDFHLHGGQEIKIDASMKHYYADQDALHVYERYEGFPIIYGMHFRRSDDRQ